MDTRPLAALPPSARFVVDNLSRVLPRDGAEVDPREPVVWLFGHPDRAASLAADIAALRRRYPAERCSVTVLLPSAHLVRRAIDDIRPLLAGWRVLEISDAGFVQQMRQLGRPFDVAVDGRRFVHHQQRWFLSHMVQALMAEEAGVDHGHPGDLQVATVHRGVVHPLARAASGKAEDHQWGGVTDAQFNFIALSATERTQARRLNTPTPPWYVGANPDTRPEAVVYVDEDVVFLGPLSKHYGHFILEGLARLWFFLDETNQRRFKAVYIAEPGIDRFNDLFSLFGLNPANLLRIDRPTAFRSVVVPEQSMRIQDRCHPLYKATVDRIMARVPAGPHRKVYFSKEMRGNYRGIGEKPMEEVFQRNGYELFYPERLSMLDTLSVLKGADSFAASSGTNAHNAIFLRDGAQCICLNRSPHVHPIQTMIDRLRDLDAVYVEANVSLLPADWSVGPFLFGPTRHLLAFFDHAGFHYDGVALRAAFPSYLAEFMTIWGHFYLDPRRQDYLEPQERSVAFHDLVAGVVDTFVHPPPPALAAPQSAPPPLTTPAQGLRQAA